MVLKDHVPPAPHHASADIPKLTTFKAWLFVILLLAAIASCVIWKLSMHPAIFIALIVGAGIAFSSGWDWPAIQNMMFDSIKESLGLIMLMLLIGIVIGLWIISGVVPTMVYYGIKLLKPETFLILAPIFTALVAIAIGTSFGTASTIGLAMMSIGVTMGVNPQLLAATLIGALFCGELLSPVAGSVNLNIALFKIEMVPYLKRVRIPILTSFGLSLIFNLWWVLNNQQTSKPEVIQEVMAQLTQSYRIHWLLLLIPLVIIFLSWRGYQTLPVLSVGAILGIFTALIVQQVPLQTVMGTIYSGPTMINSHYILEGLTSNGGLIRMMSLVTLIIMSLALAGLLEKTGTLKLITNHILQYSSQKKERLMAYTIGSGGLLATVAGSQTLAMILTNKVVSNSFSDADLDQTWGAAAVAAGAGVIPALIPWNACGLFLTSVLGVATVDYLPYSIFCVSLPFTAYIYFRIAKRQRGVKN